MDASTAGVLVLPDNAPSGGPPTCCCCCCPAEVKQIFLDRGVSGAPFSERVFSLCVYGARWPDCDSDHICIDSEVVYSVRKEKKSTVPPTPV
jgi:hypothetical protein